MRLRDEKKRQIILDTAVRLFSEKPFHKVRLDDVAAAAGIGKGTVYIYFKSKEDLYYSLIIDGFIEVIDRLKSQQAVMTDDPVGGVGRIVGELVDFALRYPQLFEAMRVAGVPNENSQWDQKRRELTSLIAEVLQQGINRGVFSVHQPELTALYFPAMIRAVMLYGPKDIAGPRLTEHICSVVLHGLGDGKK